MWRHSELGLTPKSIQSIKASTWQKFKVKTNSKYYKLKPPRPNTDLNPHQMKISEVTPPKVKKAGTWYTREGIPGVKFMTGGTLAYSPRIRAHSLDGPAEPKENAATGSGDLLNKAQSKDDMVFNTESTGLLFGNLLGKVQNTDEQKGVFSPMKTRQGIEFNRMDRNEKEEKKELDLQTERRYEIARIKGIRPLDVTIKMLSNYKDWPLNDLKKMASGGPEDLGGMEHPGFEWGLRDIDTN
jgi:hypothetical protein